MPTNYLGQLFADLSDHIKDQIPSLTWVDQDFGQLEHFDYGEEEDTFPCLLIDFQSSNYNGVSDLGQIGDVLVTLRLAFNPFATVELLPPLDMAATASSYYEVEQDLFNVVQGWHNDFTTPFIRISAETEVREDDKLRVRTIVFSTSYEDYNAVLLADKQQADLDIQGESF